MADLGACGAIERELALLVAWGLLKLRRAREYQKASTDLAAARAEELVRDLEFSWRGVSAEAADALRRLAVLPLEPRLLKIERHESHVLRQVFKLLAEIRAAQAHRSMSVRTIDVPVEVRDLQNELGRPRRRRQRPS